MYRYFESDIITVLNELMAPARPINKPAPEVIEIPKVQKACLDRN